MLSVLRLWTATDPTILSLRYLSVNNSFSQKLKKAALIGGLGVASVGLPLFLVAPGSASKRQRAPFIGRNFAHRGLHSEDRSVPENSLEAFRLAGRAGYGAELDVQLTKDGQVVVFHDETLDRICGVHARVDEKSYDELKLLSLCGTNQRIPLLTEVLEVFAGRGPLIVELKNGRRNRELCEKTYAILSNYSGEVCVESFNPFILRWFRRHGRDLLRGQLATQRWNYGEDLSCRQAFLLSHCLMNFVSRPQFIAYHLGPRPLTVRLSEAMGALRIGWTARNERAERRRDGVIFEFYRPQRFFKQPQ